MGFRQRVTRQWRVTYHLLMISVALNFAFFITICYLLIAPTSSPGDPLLSGGQISNGWRLSELKKFSFDSLKEALTSSAPIESGYKERDLALAILVNDWDFDIERACPYVTLQKRQVLFKNPPLGTITLFAGMSDAEFASIVQFTQKEKWPLTPQGMFRRLKEPKGMATASLEQAFILSTSFVSIETLFHRSGALVDQKELLEMLLLGDWLDLVKVNQETSLVADPLQKHQKILFHYIQLGSSKAADWFVKLYAPVALKQLPDRDLIAILKALPIEQVAHARFAKAILVTPRSDQVWKEAACFLARQNGDPIEEHYDHAAILARYIAKAPTVAALPATKKVASQDSTPQVLEKVAPAVASEEKVLRYIVQQGDSFARVAQLFKVNEAHLKQENPALRDPLKKGSVLLVPFKKQS